MEIQGRSLAAASLALLAVAAAAAIPAARGADSRRDSRALRAETGALSSRSRSALLDLYSLESDLRRTAAELASLRARAAQVARARADVGRRLRLARTTHALAQRALAHRLRALYEHGETDPLAILLASESLDDAIGGLEGVTALAEHDRAVIEQSDRARRRLAWNARALGAHSAELRRLERAVSAQAAALRRSRSAKLAYLERLASERVKIAQIASLERRAEAATARSEAVEARVPARPTSRRATAEIAAAEAARRLTVTVSAYSISGPTATGMPAGPGVVAVDPSLIPLGTRMTIPGYGDGVAADTGIAVRGSHIDVWVPSAAQAIAWGRRTVTITLH